jgi:hypothetical protein
MVFVGDESLVLAGGFRHLCSEMPVDIGVCHPVLDTGPSGFRVVSFTDAGGSPAASHFLLLRQKKVSKEKATHCIAPSGFPKFRTGNGPLANSWLVVLYVQKVLVSARHSNSARGRLPLPARNFGEATWGILKLVNRKASSCCAARKVTTVILSEAEGSAFHSNSRAAHSARKLGPRTSERRSPMGCPAKAPSSIWGRRFERSEHTPGINLLQATNANGPRIKPRVTASNHGNTT